MEQRVEMGRAQAANKDGPPRRTNEEGQARPMNKEGPKEDVQRWPGQTITNNAPAVMPDSTKV